MICVLFCQQNNEPIHRNYEVKVLKLFDILNTESLTICYKSDENIDRSFENMLINDPWIYLKEKSVNIYLKQKLNQKSS